VTLDPFPFLLSAGLPPGVKKHTILRELWKTGLWKTFPSRAGIAIISDKSTNFNLSPLWII